MIFPIILLGAGVATLLVFALSSTDRPVPDHPPDLPFPPMPGMTRWKGVNAILDDLKRTSADTGVPLGVLVAWIGMESAGRLGEVTRLDERGYFQLMPSESAGMGLDHRRLSTDPQYSIEAGIRLIGKYMQIVRALGIAVQGSEYYWRLVKLVHTMGTGSVQKIVAAAKVAGAIRSWRALEDYAIGHDSELLSLTKHSPKKWFPFVDKIFEAGRPFGVGDESTVVVGGFNDIVDPLDALK